MWLFGKGHNFRLSYCRFRLCSSRQVPFMRQHELFLSRRTRSSPLTGVTCPTRLIPSQAGRHGNHRRSIAAIQSVHISGAIVEQGHSRRRCEVPRPIRIPGRCLERMVAASPCPSPCVLSATEADADAFCPCRLCRPPYRTLRW
ncbi:hypothetical protein BU26DRAFT_24473 [Trematosphaeria pertusa]|uniref:Uncharacterized protein n=1 Tax=Trematosphaeria pertusa TaxID=390896 RepID=A0A6A6J142_9PLEO|nr:uncharacterized protein BU26DRAFT_24473 [Trematosphaeria pertusa]KAF2256565.1 hypothetical protein BU26DRAFT_24473 [Trematosphaeria pertusa]